MSVQDGLPIGTTVEDSSIWGRLRRNVALSVLGSGSYLAIRLGQTALLTVLLTIHDYGRVLIVLNLCVFMESVFGLRVSDVMFRFLALFREQRDAPALKGLLLLCLGVSLASGLVISVGVVALAPRLADRLYPQLELAPLFTIYGLTLVGSAFSGVYEPILRIHDRFAAIVVPQVLGSLVTLAMLCAYFATGLRDCVSTQRGQSVKAVVAAFALGALIQSVPPLVRALQLVRPFLAGARTTEAFQALAVHRRDLARCMVNSNVSGYLKFAVSPGDIFLLGVFSSPTQVALYGLARQLTAPLALFQTNCQTAVTPEVAALVARRQSERLKSLVARYTVWACGLGSLGLIGTMLLGRVLILRWAPAEYVAAVPVVYVLSAVAWLLLAFVAFRPLAVSLDLLRWYNLTLLASAASIAAVIVVGELNALTLAFVQLAEVLVLRSVFNALVWRRVQRLVGKA